MRLRPRVHPIGAAVIGTLVVLTLAACGRTIDGEARTGDVPPVGAEVAYDEVGLKEAFGESPQEVERYWQAQDPSGSKAEAFGPNDTAGPKDVPTDFFMPPTTTATPLAEAGSGMGEESAAPTFPMAGLVASTTGQLYLRMGADSYRCSATVVNSLTQDLVLTAAHCLVDTSGQGRPVSHVLFVPGATDNSGTGPYGAWTATEVYIPEQFTATARSTDQGLTGRGWSYDFAFLRTARNASGRPIQRVTGGQGIGFGIPTGSLVALGYPATAPFDGASERYCATTQPSTETTTEPTRLRMRCAMTSGASGGSWIARYNATMGAGYVVAATSTAVSEPGHASESIQAMPLGAVAHQLFIEAGGMDK